MAFREHLAAIVRGLPGARACALMGFDGIPIDAVEPAPGTLDVPTLLAEYAAAARPLCGGGQQAAQSGSAAELVVVTDQLSAVLRPLTRDYYVAVVLAPAGLVGKARFLLRQAAPRLVAELA